MAPAECDGFSSGFPAGRHTEVRNLADMNQIIARIIVEMAQAGYSEREQFGLRLSLEEAIVNGIKHGNREDPNKAVAVSYSVTPQQIVAEVEDEGPGFNPKHVPDPLAPENIERPGGRGVFLMRHYMSTVAFNERGNRVTLAKVRGE